MALSKSASEAKIQVQVKAKFKQEIHLCGQNQDLPRPKRNFENSFQNTSPNVVS